MRSPAGQINSLSLSRILLIALSSIVLLAGGSLIILLHSTGEHLLLDIGTRGLLRSMDVVEAIVRGQIDPAKRQVESLLVSAQPRLLWCPSESSL